jgi:hypothetical protein
MITIPYNEIVDDTSKNDLCFKNYMGILHKSDGKRVNEIIKAYPNVEHSLGLNDWIQLRKIIAEQTGFLLRKKSLQHYVSCRRFEIKIERKYPIQPNSLT